MYISNSKTMCSLFSRFARKHKLNQMRGGDFSLSMYQWEVGRSGFSIDIIDGAFVVYLVLSDATRKSFE